MSILKVVITMVSLFFMISYSLVAKIEICLNDYLDKKQKGSHSEREQQT